MTDLNSQICSICIEDLYNNNVLKVKCCNNSFHTKCLTEYIQFELDKRIHSGDFRAIDKIVKCPLCRVYYNRNFMRQFLSCKNVIKTLMLSILFTSMVFILKDPVKYFIVNYNNIFLTPFKVILIYIVSINIFLSFTFTIETFSSIYIYLCNYY